MAPKLLTFVPQNYYLNKGYDISQIKYHTLFQEPSVTSVDPASHFSASAILLYTSCMIGTARHWDSHKRYSA